MPRGLRTCNINRTGAVMLRDVEALMEAFDFSFVERSVSQVLNTEGAYGSLRKRVFF